MHAPAPRCVHTVAQAGEGEAGLSPAVSARQGGGVVLQLEQGFLLRQWPAAGVDHGFGHAAAQRQFDQQTLLQRGQAAFGALQWLDQRTVVQRQPRSSGRAQCLQHALTGDLEVADQQARMAETAAGDTQPASAQVANLDEVLPQQDVEVPAKHSVISLKVREGHRICQPLAAVLNRVHAFGMAAAFRQAL